MSRLCSWNIRGLNYPNKQVDIKIFLHEKNISLVGLLETKVKDKNVDKVVNKLFQGWNWHHNFHLNAKGRIWVAWRPSQFHIQILATDEQFIHCKVTLMQDMKKFFITFVYSANQDGQRRLLWEALKEIANEMEEGCCILGDFTYVLHPRDRLGGMI